jgi:hypothetical protein
MMTALLSIVVKLLPDNWKRKSNMDPLSSLARSLDPSLPKNVLLRGTFQSIRAESSANLIPNLLRYEQPTQWKRSIIRKFVVSV